MHFHVKFWSIFSEGACVQFSLKKAPESLICYQCSIPSGTLRYETIFLLVPAHCLSASPAVTQRMNRCHTPQNGVIACHSPSRQFILLDVAHAPQIFISFCSRAAASVAKRSGGGSVPREGEGKGGERSVGTSNGAEGRGRMYGHSPSACPPDPSSSA